MKTIFLECCMGASGDMLMAALLELCDDRQGFLDRLNAVGIPGVTVTAESSVKCGIVGTRVVVTVDGKEEHCYDDHHHHDDDHHHDHQHSHDNHHHHDNDHHSHGHHHHNDEHHHNDYHGIEHLIGHLNISDAVKKNALAVYKLIAEAESYAHGVPVDKIHFHEVGEMDAVADIVGVSMLMEELAPAAVIASPINVGGGHVHCAHGVLPVPAPATARILRGVPMYGVSDIGELCTPTGAAILKHFAKKFCAMPVMTVDKIGYGMGKKDFKRANCLRAYIGYVNDADNTPDRCAAADNGASESVVTLSCNLDDMTPEAVSFAQELLLCEGALDVWTTPIVMKKGRLGVTLSCLCAADTKEKFTALMFKHTATLGIRETPIKRYVLQRERSEIQTPHGRVRIKTAHGFGVTKSKPEYEDMARIARESGIALSRL